MLWHFHGGGYSFSWQRRVRPHKRFVIGVALVLVTFVGNHSPENLPKENASVPRFENNIYVTSDQTKLPFRTWFPDTVPVQAVIVALHGFNDYSRFFTGPGNYFKTFGIASYAYDQRGFGNTQQPGSWATVLDILTSLKEGDSYGAQAAIA